MIHFEPSAAKFFWYALWTVLNLLLYSFYGALLLPCSGNAPAHLLPYL